MSSSESFLSQNRAWWILPLVLVAGLVVWLLITDPEAAEPEIDTDETFQYDAR